VGKIIFSFLKRGNHFCSTFFHLDQAYSSCIIVNTFSFSFFNRFFNYLSFLCSFLSISFSFFFGWLFVDPPQARGKLAQGQQGSSSPKTSEAQARKNQARPKTLTTFGEAQACRNWQGLASLV